MDLTPKQQTSEAIRQAETILILTGQHPSVDQATAVLALAAILRKFGKTVTPIISDNPPASVAALEMGTVERGLGGSRDFLLKVDVSKAEVDQLRYEVAENKLNIHLTPSRGSFAPSDVTFGYGAFHYDLAIVLGVPTRARIDRIYEQNLASFETIPMVNLDFHRSNENYAAVNLIEPNASSLCEMLVALSESLQSGIIDAEIATALLMGIVASTDRFTASHTSPKSLTVAAQMMAAGARQQAVVRALYRDGKSESRGGQDRGERSGGQDRGGNQDRGERSGDRNRPERTAERPAERSERAPERSSERAPERERTVERAAAPSQPAAVRPAVAESAPAAAATQASTTVATTPAPVSTPPTYEQPTAAPDLPIIQPSHIELSEPESAPAPVHEAQLELVREATPVAAAAPAPVVVERPQGMPAADFAAAAEMFNVDQPATEPRAGQGVS
ncbi:MAG TPA: DHH family phosphoesterase [Candidatus Saccharimonadia bacterium]|nr:DHH family phosphoesterase [Candidatus Saccharimonadia bacterium]